MATKRLMKEFSLVQKSIPSDSEYPNILTLQPQDTLFQWKGTISGPKDTPFEGYKWGLIIDIPHTYPSSPPSVKFANKICHPNVNFQTGEICLNILNQEHWSPAWNLINVIVAILQLLGNPEPLSPLNIDVSNLLKLGDMSAYDGLIKYYAVRYGLKDEDGILD
ncbi:hypothetical protein WICPIJ_003014 [Wickerhamomyces pijperi]|uniref:UBC core domain-containing protein n=1 Tax=Wickerhamomyces pijperi TaxID=599730 RepID=A0A9P8TPA3_WICPI|nr:hypothetical protein WICPIJ_003014 [Wickerhamomyces pijperi]